jgi:hypothetical protein
MSKLYYSESGNVIPSLCEELTIRRRARKIIQLPLTQSTATLFLLARPYPGTEHNLRVSVNSTELPAISPTDIEGYNWHTVRVPASHIRSGANLFEFWTDAHAMNGWSLAIESGASSNSYISQDGGMTWRQDKLGYLNVLQGEYVVRVRLAEGTDPEPPDFNWEDPESPDQEDLRAMLPLALHEPVPLMERVRALMTWVCTSWEYRCNYDAIQYAPWDPQTIIAWGKAKQGHAGQPTIVMCVHYAVAFSSFCNAIGIPARCAALMGSLNGQDGHFVSEVWFDEFNKWVMVDPNMDAILFKGEVPLSIGEIQQSGDNLTELIRWGPGHDFQMENPTIARWIPKNYLTGICFRHRSLWSRMDFLSHPEFSPPGHGSVAYCETNFVWEQKELDDGFDMFPYFGNAEYFDAPPHTFPYQTSTITAPVTGE